MYYYKKKKKQPLFEKDIPSIKHGKVKKKTNLKAKLDKLRSKEVRLRDSREFGYKYFKCISCGKIKPIEQADAGHFFSRRHNSTRFDLDNINAECRFCNRFSADHLVGYQTNLIKKIGQKRFNILSWKVNEIKHWTDFELEEMIKISKEEIKKMEKERDEALEKDG